MGLQADVFWSFRSPYSYLATRRYRALTEAYDLDIVIRPVYPLAIREPDFFERNHPNWLRYTFTDMFRVAQFHGIPFGPPRPDPIVQDIRTRKIAEEQPYIYRLTRLGQAAARRGKSLAFCEEVSRLIWGGAENLPLRRQRLVWTLRSLTQKPLTMPKSLMSKSPQTRQRLSPRAIGESRLWFLMANPFSDRTGLTWRSGG
jgi:hypothetical protein